MLLRIVLVLAVVAAACTAEVGDPTSEPTADPTTPQPTTSAPVATTLPPPAPLPLSDLVDSDGDRLPAPPPVPDGPLSAEAVDALDRLWDSLDGQLDLDALADLAATGDARVAWLVSDVMRLFQVGNRSAAAVDAFTRLTGAEIVLDGTGPPWTPATNMLIAWDLPAPPGYVDYKARLLTLVEPGWQMFFDDEDATIDWRLVNWGGVRIDNRPLGDPNPCPFGCIPALDDPAVTDAAGGSWYADDGIVFALVLDGEARAYPKHIMEVHEMVNDTVGGRRIGMPYCTLCGSAQAYLTDSVPDGIDTPVLRTSGLLSRSNKVMYDLVTGSAFDTFRGVAVSGPLREAGVILDQVPVVTTTWGEWKAAHPNTTIVAEDGGLGNSYPLDPLSGRDDNGPIFPVGDVDPRLPVQEQVVGAIAPSGRAVAFPAAAAREALRSGEVVTLEGVELILDGGGVRAATADGTEVVTHQAFWFAWSQFHPDTAVWLP